MFIIDTSGGGAAALVTATAQATLQNALTIVRGAGDRPDLQAEFEQLLDWLKSELEAGRLTASPPFAALIAALQPDRPVTAAVGAALAASGIGQRIVNRLQDLQDEQPFLFALDAEGRPRLPTLGELEGSPTVKIELAESTTLGGDAATTFRISGSAAARVELDVLSSAEALSQHGHAVQGSALRVRATGQLDAGADIGVAPAQVSVGGEASRAISLLYQFPSTTTTLAALDHVTRDVPRGLRLRDIAGALDLPAQPGFRLLQIDRAAGFHFDLSAKLGYSQVQLRTVTASGREQPIKTEFAADAKLEIGYRNSGSRRLQILRNQDGDIVLRAEASRSEVLSAGAEIGAGIRITGWDTLAKSLMERSLPDASELLDRLGSWAQPGRWIAGRLEAQLPAELLPLIPVLVGESADAAQAIRKAITEALDARANPWLALLEQRSELLTDELVELIAPHASDRKAARLLREWLASQLDAILAELRVSLLDGLSRHLQATSASAAKRLATALAEELQAVGRAVQKGASRAEEFLQPVIGFLDDYSRLRRKLIDAAERALRFKLEVMLRCEFKRSATDTLSFELVLPREHVLGATDAGSAVVETDFRRWLRGAAFVNPMRPFDRPLAEVSVDWRARSERLTESATTLSIDLGFTGVRSKDLFSSKTEVEVGPGGVLLASTATRSERSRTWGRERVSALGRALFNAMASDAALSTFQLDVEFTDRRFSEAELRSLLASLRRAGSGMLLDDDAEAELWLAWRQLHQSAGKAPAAVLKLGLALDEDGRHALRTLCSDRERLRHAIARHMVDVCRGNPSRDLGLALATFNYAGDPVAVFVQHWNEIHRTIGYGLSRSPRLNGVAISRSSTGASLSHPWGAAMALRRSIRPANAMLAALSSAAAWPGAHEAVNRALDELRATSGFTRASPQAQAELIARRIADHHDRLGTRFAADFNRAIASSDALFDSNDDIPTNTLFVISLLATEASAELHAVVTGASQ